MKKTELAITLVLALLFSAVAGTQVVNLARANPIPPMHTEITIEKPLNTTYNVNTLPLSFSVDTTFSRNSYFYSLDGEKSKQVENIEIVSQEDINRGKSPPIIRTVLNGSCALSNLSEGWHNVTVYQISYMIGVDPDYEIARFSKNIQFRIDTLPSVLVASPENKNYTSSDVYLNFMVNRAVNWMGYTLDGKDNVIVTGNITLTGLSNGVHNVTVYAKAETGNTGASEIIYFRVDAPFPTALVAAASGVSIAAVGVGLLVYFKKRKRG